MCVARLRGCVCLPTCALACAAGLARVGAVTADGLGHGHAPGTGWLSGDGCCSLLLSFALLTCEAVCSPGSGPVRLLSPVNCPPRPTAPARLCLCATHRVPAAPGGAVCALTRRWKLPLEDTGVLCFNGVPLSRGLWMVSERFNVRCLPCGGVRGTGRVPCGVAVLLGSGRAARAAVTGSSPDGAAWPRGTRPRRALHPEPWEPQVAAVIPALVNRVPGAAAGWLVRTLGSAW